MANVQMVMFLFALLVSSTVSLKEEVTRQGKAFRLCNFFTEAGFRCIGCHERLICIPLILGFTKTCEDPNPYCNNGFCSKTKGSMCSSDNAASTSSSASEMNNATACTSESSRNFSDDV